MGLVKIPNDGDKLFWVHKGDVFVRKVDEVFIRMYRPRMFHPDVFNEVYGVENLFTSRAEANDYAVTEREQDIAANQLEIAKLKAKENDHEKDQD